MAPPKKYSDEVREQAVEAYRLSAPGRSIRALAHELGVHPEALRTWVRRDEAERASGEPDGADGDLRPTADAADDEGPAGASDEVGRLRDENAALRRDNVILLAASAMFARELDPARRRYSDRSDCSDRSD